MNSSTATIAPPSSLFLQRRAHNVPVFTSPTFLRPRNSKLLRLSASLAHLSWFSPPHHNNNDYNGWAIVESPLDSRTSKGLSRVVIGGVFGSSLALLLAAISYFSLSRKGFKFQFASPLNALHDILNRNETKAGQRITVEFDEMDGDTTERQKCVSRDISETVASGSLEKLERVIVSVAIDSTQQEALSVLKKLKMNYAQEENMPDGLFIQTLYLKGTQNTELFHQYHFLAPWLLLLMMWIVRIQILSLYKPWLRLVLFPASYHGRNLILMVQNVKEAFTFYLIGLSLDWI